MDSTVKGVYQKLFEIQKKINGLAKDAKAYGYSYVTGTKVLEFIKPLMNEYGLLLKQEVLDIENTRQDYATKSGSKSEILSKVKMKFTWVDSETGEKDENLFGANGQNDWDKGVGSALTYAERYFLLKFFHIATDEDDIDNPERKPKSGDETQERKSASSESKPLKSVNDAIAEMKNASSVNQLTAIFNANQHLQQVKEFLDALTARKEEIKLKVA